MRFVLRACTRPFGRLHPSLERGAAAVEFALVVPFLILLLLGIITAGITYSRGIGLSNAVREGSRFGATGDATVAAFASDVSTRTRLSQFDDSPTPSESGTSICVQLWKYTTAGSNAGTGTATCSQGGTSDAPTLSMPDENSYPKIPPATTAGTCVVRVLAARRYSILLGMFPSLTGMLNRGSVARYERATC
jgi:Flp pilus assembly protein TadG